MTKLVLLTFSLLFSLISSQTLSLCPYSTSATSYQETLRVSFAENLASCQAKSLTEISRNILITNSACSSEETAAFQGCYENLLAAFQSEARIVTKYQEIAVNFLIKPGKHYILKVFLEISEEELFRRNSVKITIKPLFANSLVEIYVKTNEFYLFIAESLFLQDLTFIGEDLEVKNMNFTEKCYNTKEKCCLDHRNSSDSQCFLQGKTVEKTAEITEGVYGLFNLEELFDDPMKKTPVFTIRNCNFSSFQVISHEKGWGSLIVLSPFSAKIVIEDSVFKGCFFPKSVIFFKKSVFSEFSLVIENMTNIENLQNITINNTIFEDYNEYEINDENTVALLRFIELSGNIVIESSLFQRIYQAKNLLFLQGKDAFQGNLTLYNSSFAEIREMDVFLIDSARSFSMFFSSFSSINEGSITVSNTFQPVNLLGLFVERSGEFRFSFSVTSAEIRDSFFSDLSVKNPLFSIRNSDSSFFNCSFSRVICEENPLFSMIDSNSTSFSSNFFSQISQANSVFYAFSLNFFYFYDNSMKNLSVHSIFSEKNLILSQNLGFLLQNSTFASVWSNDHVCKLTFVGDSLIQFNRISSRIIQYILSEDYYFVVENLHILDNNHTSISMISMLGTSNFTKLVLIRNFFLDSHQFQYVFDMMNSEILVNLCFFDDNGIVEKKLYYLTKDNNILMSLWTMSIARFSNSVFVVGDKIDMVSGFIEAMPLAGFFEAYNNSFIIKSQNSNFGYKGILLDNFQSAILANNSFMNLLCNLQDFHHSHGGVILAANPSLNYKKNDYSVYINDNRFVNCNCLYGGALAIISIARVSMKNNSFFNTSSVYDAGHLMIAAGETVWISGLFLDNSIANEGGGLFLQGFEEVFIEELEVKNTVSRGNGGVYCRNLKKLELRDSKGNQLFSRKNGGFLYLYQTAAFIQNIVVEQTEASLEGGAIFVQGGSSLFLKNSSINGSISQIGGSLSIENAKEIVIVSCVFTQSFSEEKGAVIFTDVLKSFHMENSSFIECSTEGNGVLFIKTEDEAARFEITSFSCIRTSARKGSCFYYLSSSEFIIRDLLIQENGPLPMFLLWSFPISLNFSYIVIKDNFIEENLVFIQGITVNFEFFFFRNNTASDLIKLQQVTGRFSSFFSENNEGVFFINLEDSQVNLEGFSMVNDMKKVYFLSVFKAVSSVVKIEEFLLSSGFSKKDVFFDSQDGDFLVENSNFFNNTGQIFRNSKNNIEIKQSVFSKNSNFAATDEPNELSFENLDKCCFSIKIEFSLFEVSSGFSIKSLGLVEISIENSSFLCKGTHCFSMTSTDSTEVSIKNSEFRDFNKGNIYFYNNEKTSQINISASFFINNSAQIGSSLYFFGNFYLNISFSSFSANKALMNSTDSSSNPLQGLAPCLFFKPMLEKYAKIVISSTSFFDNSASFIAATLFTQLAIQSLNNTFYNNSDPFNFSSKFYSYPLNLQKESSATNNTMNSIKMNITSGVPFNLDFSIIDFFGQKLIFDNKTFAILKPDPTIFSYSSSISIENGLTQAKIGSLSFKNLLVRTQPNSSFSLVISANFAGLSNNILNELNPYLIEKTLSFFARECLIGETKLADLSCFFCPEGTYSLIDPMTEEVKYQKCHVCPLNCFCYGGVYITPLSGYLRKSFSSVNAVRCLNFDACLGVPLLEINSNFISDFEENRVSGFCKEGNHDTLCFYCDKGYGKYDKTDYCKKCLTLGLMVYVRFFFYFLLMVIYILINCHFAETVHLQKKSAFANFSTFLKIIINHCQYITIIFTQMNIPSTSFADFFNVSDYLSFSQDYIITNDCVFQEIYQDIQAVIIFKGVFNTVLPFVFSIVSFVIWVMFNLMLRKFQCLARNSQRIPRNFKGIFQKIVLFIVLSTFIFYSLVVKSSFGLFQCMIIDKNDEETFLRESPNLQCWKQPHLNYVFFIGLPGLLLWGCIFPLFLYWVLRRNSSIIAKYTTRNLNGPDISSMNLNANPSFLNLSSKNENSSISNANASFSNSLSKNSASIHFKKNNSKNNRNSNIVSSFSDMKTPNKLSLKLKKDPKTKIKVHMKANIVPNDFQMAQSAEESRIFVFFYKDFKPDFFYWESLIFCRKFFLTFLASMSQTIPSEIINILMNIFLFISIFITSSRFPYQLNRANYGELASLSVSSMTVFAVLVLASDYAEEKFRSFITVICLGGNALFFAFIFGCLMQDALKRYEILKRNQKSRKVNQKRSASLYRCCC